MTVSFARGSAVALFTAFAAQTAWADLTPKEVWTDWQEYMTSAGYTVSANESMSGNDLTLSDVAMSIEMPDGLLTISMGQIQLSDNGDGTVSADFSDRMPITFNVKPENEDPIKGTVTLTQSDAAMVVSGNPDAMVYDYSAANMSVELSDLEADNKPVPSDAFTAIMNLSNIVLKEGITTTDARAFDFSITADALTYDLSFADPDSSDAFSWKGTMNTLSYSGEGVVPLEMDASDMGKMLTDGFGFDGTMTYASGNGNLSGSGEGEDFAFASSSQGGSLGVAMNAAHLAYDVAQKGIEMTVQTAELPFPVSLQLAETEFAIDMPIAKSDDEQPFAMKIKLGDFQVPEQLWSMVDPAGVLPRDPATIALDLAGKAKVLIDLFDPALAENPAALGQTPGELNAVTVNDLLISAAGAKLTGTGDFTFDNTNAAAMGGMPTPAGTANLQLVGANALIDKLIKMGLVSDQDAMGARMMMGMLAVPGDAPDTLNSEITMTKDGQILANGQRIK